MRNSLVIVSAVNDNAVLSANLLQSPDLGLRAPHLLQERGYSTAGIAYNSGLIRADGAEAVAFVHQDVYLPAGWVGRLESAISWLEDQGEPWAILGVWGVHADGSSAGRVWCSGGSREHCAPVREPAEVASIDEIVIVLNLRHGLRFDENLPGFHLYATDLILQAWQRGLKAYVVVGPVVHNSRNNPNPFDASFFRAYRYMQKKWATELPVQTCTVPITRWGVPLYRAWLRREWRRLRGHGAPLRVRHPDPGALARELRYESDPRPIEVTV
jgi:hypothetical protein